VKMELNLEEEISPKSLGPIYPDNGVLSLVDWDSYSHTPRLEAEDGNNRFSAIRHCKLSWFWMNFTGL